MLYTFATKRRLVDLLYGNTTFYVALIDGLMSSYNLAASSLTVNISTDVISVPGHNFVENTRIRFIPDAGAVLPNTAAQDINASDFYYCVNVVVGSSFKISKTRSGVALDLATTGSGNIVIQEMPLNPAYDDDLNIWIRHEVADYFGSVRQTYQAGASITDSTGVTQTPAKTITFTPTSGTIPAVRYILVIRSGNATRGSTAGFVEEVEDLGSNTDFVQNVPRIYSLVHTF